MAFPLPHPMRRALELAREANVAVPTLEVKRPTDNHAETVTNNAM